MYFCSDKLLSECPSCKTPTDESVWTNPGQNTLPVVEKVSISSPLFPYYINVLDFLATVMSTDTREGEGKNFFL